MVLQASAGGGAHHLCEALLVGALVGGAGGRAPGRPGREIRQAGHCQVCEGRQHGGPVAGKAQAAWGAYLQGFLTGEMRQLSPPA